MIFPISLSFCMSCWVIHSHSHYIFLETSSLEGCETQLVLEVEVMVEAQSEKRKAVVCDFVPGKRMRVNVTEGKSE